MIQVNMHEAKTRLSQLVHAIENQHETILLCRHGKPVAEIKAIQKKTSRKGLIKPLKILIPQFSENYNPTEPLQENELPDWLR